MGDLKDGLTKGLIMHRGSAESIYGKWEIGHLFLRGKPRLI